MKTDTRVGHRFSTLTKIEPLRSLEIEEEADAEEVTEARTEEKHQTRDIEGSKFKRVEATNFNMLDERSMEFPFSSEYPVSRYFGSEILSHNMESANLSRLNDGAPLLYNHDPDRMIGVVERAWIDGDKSAATPRCVSRAINLRKKCSKTFAMASFAAFLSATPLIKWKSAKITS